MILLDLLGAPPTSRLVTNTPNAARLCAVAMYDLSASDSHSGHKARPEPIPDCPGRVAVQDFAA
jgi:hypothetical protein